MKIELALLAVFLLWLGIAMYINSGKESNFNKKMQ